MVTEKSLLKILKEKYFKHIIISTLILIIVFIYFPRSLERYIGIKDISVNDISHVNLFAANSIKNEIFQKHNITDQDLIADILEVFSDKHIMRRRFLRHEYYKNIDRNKPLHTSISIFFKGSINPTIIDINVNPRSIKIIKIDSSPTEVNSTRYLLYGDGIDIMKLYEYVRLEN